MGQSLCAGDRNSQATVFFKKSEMYTAVKKGSPYYQKKIDSRQKKLDEAINQEIDLKKVMKDQHAAILFNEKSRGMTLKQQDEFKDLVEGLDYDSEEDFTSKLDTILETYFNKKPAATETEINEELVEVDTEDKPTGISDGPMAAYAQAISRTLQK